MKVIYRNVTENRLCIWIYDNDGKTFVCHIHVEKAPSGFYSINVHKGGGA
jgi:hypothetical protein